MLKKSVIIISCLVFITSLFSFAPRGHQKVLRTIVIDAGHGRKENGGPDGAKGSYSFEDDICYEVAQKLVILLKKEFPEIKILQTRPTPNYIGLKERANYANQNKGDLFISIHANAAPPIQHKELTGYKTIVSYVGKGKKKKKITSQIPQYRYYTTPNPSKGTETYIWGSHKTEDKDIAIRENAPMFGEENYKEKYGDIDPNSPEFIALSLLKTKQFFKRSAALAGMVEEQFSKVGRISRGQRQRQVGIWVLQATAMPSILVETGYITNPTEENYLNSDTGQQEIAGCISNALRVYISWLEKQESGMLNTTKNTLAPSNNTEAFLQMVEDKEKKSRTK
ncbi:MAG: N-acetylmuramoyl-L-alanine amidase [Bacteroidota bacterium]|nr:N-acetylmuramoyl-L-alanine amidase [Flavisolibacter sp.]MBD0351331.1 N-acetylmuramoyl-L-alanine amidase [Flavisolibacter sp.]MBD0365120.1 N-acetylmuramoyl-L-alanine amidase [Flavisolibacter sp.]MBD0375887.1 N-acetylmuramoyl-L-alanine amidase [Flavisolibacter sp.]MDQ3842660.1 N-acetylmuramoyl-L-alanine amidase [Bacteroidota bacterium]